MTANLLPVFDIADPESSVRLRELRMTALLLLGRQHPLTRAVADAIADPGAIGTVIARLAALAALPRRRLLATMAAVLSRA